MNFRSLAFLAAAFFFQQACASGGASQEGESFSGTYSSICEHQESGDILGVEISFVYYPSDASIVVLYQYAEGQLPPPQLITLTRENSRRMAFRSGKADVPSFTIDTRAGSKLLFRLLGEGNSEATWEETLVRRKPVWGEKQTLLPCTTRGH